MWLNAGTPAVTLLMSRGLREIKADAKEDAIEDFSAAIMLDPNLAEACHQRAIARFAAGDTPARSPTSRRRCSASHAVSPPADTVEIAETRKDWNGAYDAWRKVLEIDPKTRAARIA